MRARLALLTLALALPARAQETVPPPAETPAQAPADTVPRASEPRDDVHVPRVPVLIVNRSAVLENSEAARALQRTEREVLERVSAELARVKAELEAEEKELAELRGALPTREFDERARAFDRKVRSVRRADQERRALFQKFAQDARSALASALPRVLEQVRAETGALALLDAAAVAAADPALDATALAIARYDEEMGEVRFDPPEELIPE